jgi:hypothetical protein
MKDSQSPKPTDGLTRQIEASNRLAEFVNVVCPACGTQHSVRRGDPHERLCGCLQKLDADAHKAEVIRERQRLVLTLISARRIREFMLDLLNMPGDTEDVAGAARLVNRFSEFFPKPFPDDCWLVRSLREERGVELEERKTALGQLIGLRNHLRYMWRVPEKKTKDWLIHEARKAAFTITAHPTISSGVIERMLVDGPPPEDALQQALLYCQARTHLARLCANPMCDVWPYFFAEKPNQRYCSDSCSYATRAEAKKQWWIDKGHEWRKSQRAATSRRKAKKKGAKHAKRSR